MSKGHTGFAFSSGTTNAGLGNVTVVGSVSAAAISALPSAGGFFHFLKIVVTSRIGRTASGGVAVSHALCEFIENTHAVISF